MVALWTENYNSVFRMAGLSFLLVFVNFTSFVNCELIPREAEGQLTSSSGALSLVVNARERVCFFDFMKEGMDLFPL